MVALDWKWRKMGERDLREAGGTADACETGGN